MRHHMKHMLLSLVTMLVLIAVVYWFQVPNPNMILITGLTVFTSLFGFPSGIACGGAMIVYSLFFFSTDHSFVRFNTLNLQKMLVIVAGVTMNVAFIGNLKARHDRILSQIEEMNQLLLRDRDFLETQSMVDALTGVRNRFALTRDSENYERQQLHVMMLDLDNFKQLNDRFGHLTGDQVLRSIGAVLREVFGEGCCYRYGGDEFLVLMPDTEESTFAHLCAQMQQRLSGIRPEPHSQPIGISAGYVFGRCELAEDMWLMMHHADHCLYEAKRRGKNQVHGERFSRIAAELMSGDSVGKAAVRL